MQNVSEKMAAADAPELARLRSPSVFWRTVVVVLTTLGILRSIDYLFRWNLLGTMEMSNAYLYFMIAAFLPIIFIVYPATKKSSRSSVPWYDAMFVILALSSAGYLSTQGFNIIQFGWDYFAPAYLVAVAIVLGILVLEGCRRAGGLVLFITVLVFAVYPLFAEGAPGLLHGIGYPPIDLIIVHILSENGIIGLAMAAFGDLLIGFIVFGVVLIATGGGKFFLDLAYALLGTTRGGPAKVSVFASSLFGMLSGSAIGNVVTTGVITIPTMKKIGYSPEFAGAVEANASTGGVLMPPIMGVTAFIMAQVLAVPYISIAIAAAIPSILYYACLFTQVDAYAAINGLKGLPKAEIPKLKDTLKSGWVYLFGIAALIYFLFLRLEAQAPYAASLILIITTLFNKHIRLTPKGLYTMLEDAGKTLCMMMGILGGIGFIIGAFSITGLGGSLSHEIIALAGNNVLPLLLFGAIASFILGMGMTISACYIFLAVMLAPALVAAGFNPIAVHLFILYWGMASYITPPVALASYAASTIAKGNPAKTGLNSMKLGIVMYLIPFFFVFSPSLVLQGDLFPAILINLPSIAIGVFLIGASFQGYMLGIGRIYRYIRVLTGLSGLLLAIPAWQPFVIGLGLLIFVIIRSILNKKRNALAASKVDD